MPRQRLTDTAIRKLPAAENGTVWYSDDSVPGFQLAVGKRSRSFYMVKSINGRNVRKRIGEWPGLPAAGARKEAEKLRGTMSQGVDPRRKATMTLRESLDDYIEHNTHPSRGKLSKKSADEYRATLRRYCPKWLDRDLQDITVHDVESLHKKLGNVPYSANHTVKLIRALFKHRGSELPLKKGLYYREMRRVNEIDDLTAFYDGVQKIDWPPKRAVWLFGVYTGIRRSALCGLRWDQVDLIGKTVHLDRMKNGLERTLPLSEQAVAVIKEMVGLHGRFVFPRRDGKGPITEPRDNALPFIFHNTRNVFTEAGFSCLLPEPVVGFLRGDKLTKTVAQGYVSRLDLDVLREAVNKIGSFVEQRMAVK